ncbi:hypothetical protein [Sorangium sp. So ce1000]|uniref:hypothetical protein n=1 Tax=Sorangium sp. So ce1000 TaxID=3133325 RepID=UPI003F6441BC
MPRFDLIPSPSLTPTTQGFARIRAEATLARVLMAVLSRIIEPRTYAAGRPLDADR